MSRAVFLIITWFLWFLFAQGAVFAAIYLTSAPERTNTFASPNPLIAVSSLLFLAVLGVGIRFAIGKVNNTWAVFLLSIIGISVSLLPMYFGAFLAPEFKVVFQGLSALLFAAYIPQFIFPKAEELTAA